MKNFFRRFMLLFDMLSPFAGIVFYFTNIRIGLYICAAYFVLFAIQRFITRGDMWTPIEVIASIAIAAIVAKFTSLEMLPFAAVLICGRYAIETIIFFPVLIAGITASSASEIVVNYNNDDDDDDNDY
ncbi:MAG: hypothetical protein ACI3V2_00350 [Faecousia sp.]